MEREGKNAQDWVVRRRLAVLLKVKLLHLLPTSHDASSSANSDIVPDRLERLVRESANVRRVRRERHEVVARLAAEAVG